MNKIKKIRISNFRIYHGTEEFDFTKNDSVANLIAIYAPNGYGKTSFFDAVEWSYSGKIMRLESNGVLKKSLKETDFLLKDKIVLTNRKSYQENKKNLGRVEIETQGNTLVRRVVTRKRPGINVTDDYKPGNLNESFVQAELSGLADTNILSQDQIDSFLRYKTPEEKFNELKVFWPQGEEAVNKCNYLISAESALVDRLESVGKDIAKAKVKIGKIGSSEEAIVKINQAIQNLSSDENISFSSDFLANNVTKDEYDSLLKNCILAIAEVNKKIDEKVKVEFELSGLSDRYYSYSKNILELEELEKEIGLINNKKKLYADLKSLEKQKTQIERVKLEADKKQADYETFQQSKARFTKEKNNIDALLSKNKALKSHVNDIKYKISINRRWLSRLKAGGNQIVSKLKSKKEEYKQYASNKEKYFNFQQQVGPVTDELKEIRANQNLNRLNVDSIQDVHRNLTSIVDGSEWASEYLSKYSKLKPEVLKFVGLDEQINKVNILLEEKRAEFNRSNSLNDSLEKIKGWGEDYVESTNVKVCPLCTSEFETFNDLIEKIKSEKGSVLKIEVLQRDIRGLDENLKVLIFDKKAVGEKIKRMIGKLIAENAGELKEYLSQRDELQNKKFVLEKKKNHLVGEIVELSKYLKQYIDLDVELEEKNISEFENCLVAEIKSLDDYEARISKLLERRGVRGGLLDNAVAKTQEQVDSNRYQSETLQESEFYQAINALMERYEIQFLDDETLNNIFLIDIDESNENNSSFNEINVGIEKVNERLLDCGCEYKYVEIDGVLVEFDVKRKNLNSSIKSYSDLYKAYVGGDGFSIDGIELKKIDSSKRKTVLETTLNKIEVFQADINILESAVEKVLIEKEIVNLNNEIPELTNAKEKIVKAKGACVEYIQVGINNYFNKDVINQIYKRIEPHPNLTEINFTAEVGSNGPRLLITAKGLDDEVNPNLFLSAGQVNVLSLSIFLAKAFEHGGDRISTIFMDDPVQNLSDINILSFIDLLRTLTSEHNKQVVISTHEEKFYRLLQNKLPVKFCSSKYFSFESEGKLLHEDEGLMLGV